MVQGTGLHKGPLTEVWTIAITRLLIFKNKIRSFVFGDLDCLLPLDEILFKWLLKLAAEKVNNVSF